MYERFAPSVAGWADRPAAFVMDFAVGAKLDEVIRALDNGRNECIGIEHLSEHDLIAIRDKLERECGRETPEPHDGPRTASRTAVISVP